METHIEPRSEERNSTTLREKTFFELIDIVSKMRKTMFIYRMVWEIIQGQRRRVRVCRGEILVQVARQKFHILYKNKIEKTRYVIQGVIGFSTAYARARS